MLVKIYYSMLIKFTYWIEKKFLSWVLVSLISKISNDWIRDLEFNPYISQKPINTLIW